MYISTNIKISCFTHLVAFQQLFVVLLKELPSHVTSLGVDGHGDNYKHRVLSSHFTLKR